MNKVNKEDFKSERWQSGYDYETYSEALETELEELKKLLPELFERRRKIYDVELTKEHWEKLGGLETEGGRKVKVTWKDDYEEEYGYLFALDFCAEDEADIFCHFKHPQNSGGMDNAPPIWMHMYELMTNEMVVSITVN